jgi:dTDP-4-amino-4,6-dideoxygalactose transaminase
MAVPLLDIPNHNKPYFEQMKAAFAQFLESGQYIGGPNVEGFEQELAKFLGVNHCIATSSGTDALLLAMMSLGIQPGDEVLCPAFTFFATAGVVHRLGATPVFVDIDNDTFNIRPEDLEEKITAKTKAIVPVHLFGQLAEMERIMATAEHYNIPVVEDAAQAIGAKRDGARAGSIGAMGAFSFYPTKNLSAFGDAGFISTNDADLAAQAKMLRIHGMNSQYYYEEVGGNFRFDPIQGMLLRLKLPDIDAQNAQRETNANLYRTLLLEHNSVALGHLDSEGKTIVLPVTAPNNTHVWHQFTVRVQGEGKRDALLNHLREKKIGCGVYYPLGLHKQKCFESVVPEDFQLPNTDLACQEVLSLPIFPELTKAQIEEVCTTIIEFLDKQ